MTKTKAIFAGLALLAPLVACDKQQDPAYPEGSGAGYPGGYGAQHGGQGAQNGGPNGGTGPGSPEATVQATPLPAGAAVLSSPMLKGTAQSETVGMTEDGGAFGATFAEGQIFEQAFQIQPGRCYTVVGLGVGISELDIEIVLQQAPAPEWVAASDGTAGPHAIVGGKGQCFESPLPVGAPAKVRIKATGGSGVAVAQLYSR